jgi:opacity protein-like surface antigen
MGAGDSRSDHEIVRCRLDIAGGVCADRASDRLRRIHDLNLRLISSADRPRYLKHGDTAMTRMIMMLTTLSLAATLAASPAHAQGRWELEVRGHSAVSTQDAARDSHENGFGFEGVVSYRFLPHLALYGGWNWTQFAAIDAIAGPAIDLEETGYVLGLRFEHPFRAEGGSAYWLRAGATYNHLELENADGELVADSGHGVGWEAAGGVALPIGNRWSVKPGLRYRAISRDLDLTGRTTTVDLQHLSVEMGFAFRF